MHEVTIHERSKRTGLRRRKIVERQAVASNGEHTIATPWTSSITEFDAMRCLLEHQTDDLADAANIAHAEHVEQVRADAVLVTRRLMCVENERATEKAVHAVRLEYLDKIDGLRRDCDEAMENERTRIASQLSSISKALSASVTLTDQIREDADNRIIEYAARNTLIVEPDGTLSSPNTTLDVKQSNGWWQLWDADTKIVSTKDPVELFAVINGETAAA